MLSSSFPESTVDVLIIGAGPAGLMAANALVRAGVSVRIVDKRTADIRAGQADGIQPRTIEVLESYGLGERLRREGARFYRTAFYNPGPDGGIIRTQHATSIRSANARYPYIMIRNQAAMEAILQDSMREKELRVEHSTIPSALDLSEVESELTDLNAHPVKVTLKHLNASENEDEVVHAKFVIGSDGAHSWVRKHIGIDMEGDQTESVWGVIDVVPETDFPDIRNRALIHSNHGTLMNIPREGDLVRFYIQLSEHTDFIDPDTGRIDRNRASPEKLIEAAARILHPFRIAQVGEIDWWTVYIIGQRVASRFSLKDRVLIAGDACHTHSPKAGQGMNASMLDTHNLAWKLAYFLRGWASFSLLQTYESERLKYARDLIDFDRKWSKLFMGKPVTADNQDGVSHEEFFNAFEASGGFSSGIGVRYEPSRIVHNHNQHQSYASKLVIGERMVPHGFVRAADMRPIDIHDQLPSDTRFKILVFIGNIADEGTMARLRALADRMDAPDGFLKRFGTSQYHDIFDVQCICATRKDKMDFTDVPAPFRSHWSKVLLDDSDMRGRWDGSAFSAYGIDADVGAIVVVRPDGYVGTVAPFERLDDLGAYFASFLRERSHGQ